MLNLLWEFGFINMVCLLILLLIFMGGWGGGIIERGGGVIVWGKDYNEYSD